MIDRWNAYWHGASSGARGTLLERLVLLLLAFDCWLELVSHGARYGEGAFNVAHFAWLDAVQPVPTPAIYVGTVTLAGLLAFAQAVGRPTRAGMIALALSYTYGWAMSLLDAYQHHYLLSWVLLLFVFYPAAWARHLSAVCIACVYFFTGITKTDPAWRSGAALEHIAHDRMRPFLAFAERLHVPTDTFWTLVGHSVVVLQFVVAAGYLVAPRRDGPSKVAAWLATLAWFAAMAFHIGAEVLDLKIGWFSYYMMIAASALLLPRRPVEWMARHIDRFDAWFRDVANDAATETASVMVQVVLTAAVAVGIASSVDMPGVTAAISLGMASIAVGVFVAARRGRLGVPWRMNAAAFVGALALWAAFSLSETRYDFYRFAGGDARKRGEYERALEAYQKADRYAPEGKSRRAEVEAMKRALGR